MIKAKLMRISTICVLVAAFLFAVAVAVGTGFGLGAQKEVLADETHTHDGFTKWTSTDRLPSAEGSYYLSEDVALSDTWTVPSGTTNLCLNGHGIKMMSSTRVIYVGDACTLNIYDFGEREHKFTFSDAKVN